MGPDVDINLDLNFNFKPESCMRIARVLHNKVSKPTQRRQTRPIALVFQSFWPALICFHPARVTRGQTAMSYFDTSADSPLRFSSGWRGEGDDTNGVLG